MGVERLQKLLARAGVASRRAGELLITRGRIKVDGKVITELGAKADLRTQNVELDGRRLMPEPFAYVVLHKPRGYVTTLRDPEGRPTVADLIRGAARLVPVGRLDFATSGVLLMTNDGDFAAALTHPRHRVPKTYVAKVAGRVEDSALEEWRQSIVIDGKSTQPANVRRLRWEGDKTWLEITIHEGRNRQVRRLGEMAGSKVLRLARIAQAGITHDGLRPGEWRYLTVDELASLQQSFGVPRKVRAQERGTEGRLVERSSERRTAARTAAMHEEDRLNPGARSAAREAGRARFAGALGVEDAGFRGDRSRKRQVRGAERGEASVARGPRRVERGEASVARGPRRVERGEASVARGPRRVERGEASVARGPRRVERGEASVARGPRRVERGEASVARGPRRVERGEQPTIEAPRGRSHQTGKRMSEGRGANDAPRPSWRGESRGPKGALGGGGRSTAPRARGGKPPTRVTQRRTSTPPRKPDRRR